MLTNTYGLPFFGAGNAKLPDSTLTFALPSGHTCPGALHCLATADRHTGRITDGPEQIFRCYEASIESRYATTRDSRWRNFELVRSVPAEPAAERLLAGIAAARSHKTTHVRWFTGGDLFSTSLLHAILLAAEKTDTLIHYFYTKNLPLLAPRGRLITMPSNLRVTASWGGKFDAMIEAGIFPRSARVVHTREEARALGLAIDTTDALAWQDEPTHFCHLTHGGQRAGSTAGLAITQRRRAGDFTGYGSRKSVAA